MFDFEPTAMSSLAHWLTHDGLLCIAGFFAGSVSTGMVFIWKLNKLRRDGVL